MKSNIRDENNNYTELAVEIHDKFREAIAPIIKEYSSKMHTDDIQLIGIGSLAAETTFCMLLKEDH